MKEIANELRSPRWVAWGLILLFTAILGFRYGWGAIDGRTALPPEYAISLDAWQTVQQGGNPYAQGPTAFKYPPGTLTLVGLLPTDPRSSWFVFATLSLALLAVSLGLGSRYSSWRSVILLVLGWALAWAGLLETLESGQLELLIFGLAVASALFLRRRPLVCGLIAGTLPWMKLPWMLLLLPLILVNEPSLQGAGKRVRRARLVFSGYLLSWLIWGSAVPSLVFGPERAMALTGDWIDTLVSQPMSLYLSRVNQSVWTGTLRIFGDDPLLGVGIAAIAAGSVLGALIAKAIRVPPNRDVLAWLAPWLLLIQLFSPMSWRWGSVFALAAPFAIAVANDRPRRMYLYWWRYPLLALGVGLALLQFDPIAELIAGKTWTELHEYGAFTGFWTVLLLLCL